MCVCLSWELEKKSVKNRPVTETTPDTRTILQPWSQKLHAGNEKLNRKTTTKSTMTGDNGRDIRLFRAASVRFMRVVDTCDGDTAAKLRPPSFPPRVPAARRPGAWRNTASRRRRVKRAPRHNPSSSVASWVTRETNSHTPPLHTPWHENSPPHTRCEWADCTHKYSYCIHTVCLALPYATKKKKQQKPKNV